MTTTASKQALLIREMAGPEKIPWVRMAYTLVAPAESSLQGSRTGGDSYNSLQGNRLRFSPAGARHLAQCAMTQNQGWERHTFACPQPSTRILFYFKWEIFVVPSSNQCCPLPTPESCKDWLHTPWFQEKCYICPSVQKLDQAKVLLKTTLGRWEDWREEARREPSQLNRKKTFLPTHRLHLEGPPPSLLKRRHSLVSCVADGATGVRHIVHKNGHPVLHVSH